ncbi:CDP-diacylglycerol--glycerol-3-phosphate 3-phosphatidyltransferase [Teredinibacter franksiae]|jgi:CDP-diacylglycerol--glycerol-3-phosphate 3-phosphatidyltransferase (EC 2.7.8.5)|uniref:CDP-diacylglycerol--glycerol-3-phosphate 3-phosphatidyltransferase n=1 Tax=Teredinibacter franksiae TaxID=2761453 RepID=UPI00162805E3|nr:CDP-diacylglycerol--glycerol-3-phosphate 3-phosphatidyltransferase [Teredinibacter franksiae]
MFNIANQLTLIRIVFIPLLVVIYYTPFEWRFLASAALFGLAGITDALDGYIARKYNLTTPFGAFLDPVADKLMVAVALAVLIESHSNIWFTLPATVIICREIVISALREWMAELGERATVAVSVVGKIKTTLQIIAIVVLLMVNPKGYPLINTVGYVAIYAAAILTLWSMFVYLKAAWPTLKGHSETDEEKGDT